jgi:hypothetical protein
VGAQTFVHDIPPRHHELKGHFTDVIKLGISFLVMAHGAYIRLWIWKSILCS